MQDVSSQVQVSLVVQILVVSGRIAYPASVVAVAVVVSGPVATAMANVPEQIVVPVPVVVVVLVLVLVQEALVVPAVVLLVMDLAVDQEEPAQMEKPKSL